MVLDGVVLIALRVTSSIEVIVADTVIKYGIQTPKAISQGLGIIATLESDEYVLMIECYRERT